MYTIHGTAKLLKRVRQPVEAVVEHPTTALGNWYTTVIFWRPQTTFFVNETTLFPVLLPLAPAASLAARFADTLESILRAIEVSSAFIATEKWAMSESSFAKTKNRSVLGVMNRLEFELDFVREEMDGDLEALSLWMSDHLVGPLRGHDTGPRERS